MQNQLRDNRSSSAVVDSTELAEILSKGTLAQTLQAYMVSPRDIVSPQEISGFKSPIDNDTAGTEVNRLLSSTVIQLTDPTQTSAFAQPQQGLGQFLPSMRTELLSGDGLGGVDSLQLLYPDRSQAIADPSGLFPNMSGLQDPMLAARSPEYTDDEQNWPLTSRHLETWKPKNWFKADASGIKESVNSSGAENPSFESLDSDLPSDFSERLYSAIDRLERVIERVSPREEMPALASTRGFRDRVDR